VTLNDPERHNNPYFVFFPPNSIALQADYVTVVEDVRKISSPSLILLLLAKTNAPCSAVPLQQLSFLFFKIKMMMTCTLVVVGLITLQVTLRNHDVLN